MAAGGARVNRRGRGRPGPGPDPRSGRVFAALAVPNFRLYFAGQAVSLVGTWMQVVAQSWLVLELTGSGTLLGLVALLLGLLTVTHVGRLWMVFVLAAALFGSRRRGLHWGPTVSHSASQPTSLCRSSAGRRPVPATRRRCTDGTSARTTGDGSPVI